MWQKFVRALSQLLIWWLYIFSTFVSPDRRQAVGQGIGVYVYDRTAHIRTKSSSKPEFPDDCLATGKISIVAIFKGEFKRFLAFFIYNKC